MTICYKKKNKKNVPRSTGFAYTARRAPRPVSRDRSVYKRRRFVLVYYLEQDKKYKKKKNNSLTALIKREKTWHCWWSGHRRLTSLQLRWSDQRATIFSFTLFRNNEIPGERTRFDKFTPNTFFNRVHEWNSCFFRRGSKRSCRIFVKICTDRDFRPKTRRPPFADRREKLGEKRASYPPHRYAPSLIRNPAKTYEANEYRVNVYYEFFDYY